MRVLGIDTSGRRGGVAVVEDGRILASLQHEAPKGFGDVLYPLIEQVLASAGVRLDEIDLFSAAAGPGSFTGVRVGLTAAKALGEALDKPVVGVSNLEALAAACEQRPCAVVLDARRQETYGAVFGKQLESLLDQTVQPWSEFFELASKFDPVWVATDASIFDADGAAPLPPGASIQQIGDVAAALAQTAPRLLPNQGPPELVEANYIRRPDAERNWKG